MDFQKNTQKYLIKDRFLWNIMFVHCPTHEKHEIKCSMNKNDFTVAWRHLMKS